MLAPDKLGPPGQMKDYFNKKEDFKIMHLMDVFWPDDGVRLTDQELDKARKEVKDEGCAVWEYFDD